MASLQDSTVNGLLTITGNTVTYGNTNITPWTQLSHCADATSTSICNPVYSCGRLHVRTPLNAAALGWNPAILEVVGVHTYSGEVVEDWKAVINVNGYQGAPTGWYGSQVFSDNGTNSQPYVYISNSTYGGAYRVCFSTNKIGCCCAGTIYVRWRNVSSYWNDYAWATGAYSDSQASPTKLF